MSWALRLLIAVLLFFVFELYLFKKITGAIKNLFKNFDRKKLRFVRLLLLIYFNFYPMYGIFLRISGSRNLQLPENSFTDYFIIYPFWLLVMFVFQISILTLPFDLLKLALWKFYKKAKNKIVVWESGYVLALSVVFLFYIPARVIYDYNTVDTRIVEYEKEKLPEALKGFKIGLISDVQADRYTDKKRFDKFISVLNEAEPDLVLIAGDIITSTPDYIESAAESLSEIKTVYGTYSCVGDHDNWAYRGDYKRSLREVTAALKNAGIPMIDNDRIKLNVDSAKIGVTFITDNYVTRVKRKTIDSLSNDNCDLEIFLTHQPNEDIVNAARENNYDLFFAGHTHGGQITLLFPFFKPSITHVETNYVRGDFWFDKMLMIVTPGLGMSLAPIRYNSTPEITIIKLI
ncbi:MAG: metallophosphoesterase [Melioribacteraceae bacterium]|nr:metallophosphoesterase [Melioribacteraceae bacterium]